MSDTQGIRSLFTSATLRGIMGLPRSAADVILATIGYALTGTPWRITKNRQDIRINYLEVFTGAERIGKLYVPANFVFRAPPNGDSCFVLKPVDADGPGVPYVLHGDVGSDNSVPSWFGNAAGLYAPEAVRVESTKSDVSMSANVSAPAAAVPSVALSASGGINVTSGSNQNINANPGTGAVVVAGGSLPVGRVSDTVTGQAGPYPLVSGQIASGTPQLLA